MMSELCSIVGFMCMLSILGKFKKNGSLQWWLLLGMLFLFFSVMMKFPLIEAMKINSIWSFYDYLSLLLVMLSIYLLVMMIVASSLILNMNYNVLAFKIVMLFLLLILWVSFMSGNFIIFYFMFEASLMPTLFIIMGWGYQPERLQAGVYFMVYTLFMSLPLFVILLYFGESMMMEMMWNSLVVGVVCKLGYLKEVFVSLFLVVAFLVKLPMFLIHLWLPKAHVEAPVAGSMVLAGVLLKMGGYGLYRVFFSMNIVFTKLGSGFISLSLLGMIYIGSVCCRLNDMKSLVAYSSVSHMGLVLCGLFMMVEWGVNGAVVLMISHGVGSSGLFCFVNLVYERTASRSMYVNKGVITYIPMYSFFMFMLCASNISAPPSINFMSEIMLVVSVMNYENFMLAFFGVGTFMGVVFTFYLYSFGQHGKFFNNLESLSCGGYMDYHILVMHLLPIYMLVLKNELVIG